MRRDETDRANGRLQVIAQMALKNHGGDPRRAASKFARAVAKDGEMLIALALDYLERFGGQFADDGQMSIAADAGADQPAGDARNRTVGPGKSVHVNEGKQNPKRREHWRTPPLTPEQKEAITRAKLIGLGVFARHKMDRLRRGEAMAFVAERAAAGVEYLTMGNDEFIRAAIAVQSYRYAQADDDSLLSEIVPNDVAVQFEVNALRRLPELTNIMQTVARQAAVKQLESIVS